MNYPLFKENVCKKIKNLRTEKKLTQEVVAGLKMGLRTYQKIESGINAPSLESLLIIADALGVHPKELLNVQLVEEKAKRR